jgi:hypothetical protein
VVDSCYFSRYPLTSIKLVAACAEKECVDATAIPVFAILDDSILDGIEGSPE